MDVRGKTKIVCFDMPDPGFDLVEHSVQVIKGTIDEAREFRQLDREGGKIELLESLYLINEETYTELVRRLNQKREILTRELNDE